MMKRKSGRIAALLLCVVLVIAFAGCGGATGATGAGSTSTQAGSSTAAAGTSKAPDNGSAAGDVTKVVVAMPTAYDMPDAGDVQKAINDITESKYGISFEFMFIAMGNWQQQSNLLMTGDEVDITAIFSTPLTVYVKNGQLVALDDYYANASGDFQNVWSSEELQGTTVNGSIYAIPNMRNFGNYMGLNIDAEIAAEFGIQEGQKLTMEDVDKFIRDAHEKYPDRYGIAPRGDNVMGEWSWDGLGDNKYIGVLPDCGQSIEVQNLFETDDFREFCTWTRSWYQDGLIMQDVLSNTENWKAQISSKKAVACFDNYGVNGVADMIRTVIIEPWAVANSYSALCYGMNINSKVKDAAWKAMEILYTDTDVAVLLNNGIEGKHYTMNDDGTISFPDGKSAAEVGYGMADLSWVTPYSALSHPLDVNGATFFEDLLVFNKETTLKSKAFGFSFDTTPVVDQYTACINVMDKYYKALLSGAVDVESTIEQANSEFEAAGLADVIAAKQQQLDAYLAG
ncbi:ABC transporter substrate-binding protein [Ruminococcaceae bacterium OttesenSCG-928-L11]|nr:ABC transporter substrate-binding protein [Ruminococcaceae bacterium OttesenSCG-928-L11]